MKKICPFNITKKFTNTLRERFWCPNVQHSTELIRRQFMSGDYAHAGGDWYSVMIIDIPALVAMRDATLITVREMPREGLQ